MAGGLWLVAAANRRAVSCVAPRDALFEQPGGRTPCDPSLATRTRRALRLSGPLCTSLII